MQIINTVSELPRHPTKQYAKRDLAELKYIAVHHSGTTSGDPHSFARYHINERDWPGIGYDYVIMMDGTVYKTNNLTTVNYHVGDKNREAVGICLVGNFDQTKPTQAQYEALAELCRLLLQEYPWLEIKGHKHLQVDRTCPGKNFDFVYLQLVMKSRPTYEELEKQNKELREKLKQINQLSSL